MGKKGNFCDLVSKRIDQEINTLLLEAQKIRNMKTAMYKHIEKLDIRYNTILERIKELERIENQ